MQILIFKPKNKIKLMTDFSSQKNIYEHDLCLYNAIKDYVPLLPDFRPLDTINKMKHIINIRGELVPEPQNNWKLVNYELESIGYNPDHIILLESINKNNIIIENSKIAYEFLLSYPALIWLLFHIGYVKEVSALLIYLGINNIGIHFKDLLNCSKISFYLVHYIRDEETAKFVYDRSTKDFPNPKKHFTFWIKRGMISYVLWALQDPSLYPTRKDLEIAVENGDIPITKILLKDKRVNLKDTNALLIASNRCQPEILFILLQDERLKPNFFILEKSVLNQCKENTHLLLKDGRIDPTTNNNQLITETIRNNYSYMTKILLQDERVHKSINHNVLMTSIHSNNSAILQLILENPYIDPGGNNNDALRTTIYYQDNEMIQMLLNHPRINITENDLLYAKSMEHDNPRSYLIVQLIEYSLKKQINK